MSALGRGQRLLVAFAERIVPAAERAAWRREWKGELGTLEHRLRGWPERGRRHLRAAVRVALRDALWMRLHPRRARAERPLRRAALALATPIEEPTRGGAILRDARLGLRRLRRSPGYALTAASFLALSIAASTAAFCLLDAIVLRPLAYADADRLVRIVAFDPAEGQEEWMSHAELEVLGSGAEAFDAVASSTVFPATWQRTDGRSRVQRALVSPGYFELLGTRAARGRLLGPTAEDEASAVLSHSFWRRHWPDGDEVLGSILALDGRSYTVVGVAAPDTYTHELSGTAADVWLVWPRSRPMNDPDFRIFTGVARLAPGRTLAEARGEASALEARLAADRPAVYGGWQLAVEPLRDTVVGASRRSLWLIFGALALVTVGMCANLANLVLVRLLGRRGELAVHLALGGRRGVVARQLATESALLALAGGVVGWWLAALAIRRLPGWLPFDLPRAGEVGPDARTLLFALAVTAVATLLSGALPAWIGARVGIARELRLGGRSPTARVGWLRSGSIVAQVAIALPLLVAAGLLARSVVRLGDAELGMRPAGLVSARVSVGFDLYPKAAARAAYFDGLLTDLRARSGIEAAGALLYAPLLADQQDRTRFAVVGAPAARESEQPRALMQLTTAGAFQALGARLLAGRDFDHRDVAEGPPVAIVSEALGRKHFAGIEPLGRELTLEVIFDVEAATRTVIGVVEDVAHLGPGSPREATIYLPHGQVSWPSMAVVMRIVGSVDDALRALREAAREREPTAVIDDAAIIPDALRSHLAVPRAAAFLIAALATVATALMLLGLYALLAYDAARAEHEVAVRMAVGATAGAIRRRLMARALVLVGVGTALGLLLAVGTAHGLRTMVFGLPTFDAASFGLALVALIGIAVLAGWLPAARVARTSPAAVLREG